VYNSQEQGLNLRRERSLGAAGQWILIMSKQMGFGMRSERVETVERWYSRAHGHWQWNYVVVFVVVIYQLCAFDSVVVSLILA